MNQHLPTASKMKTSQASGWTKAILVNDITNALERKQACTVLFVDLYTVFESGHHIQLTQPIMCRDTGLSDRPLGRGHR